MNLEMGGYVRTPLVEAAQPNIFNPSIGGSGIDRFPYPNAVPNISATSVPWAQVPPVSVPWGLSPNNVPNVVRFNANPNINTFQTIPRSVESIVKYSPSVAIKRKVDLKEPEIPTKIHVTDEKMAAHMNEMHISNNYVSHEFYSCTNPAQPSSSVKDVDSNVTSSHLMENDSGKLPSLVLCEELRKLKNTPILPEPFLSVEKPCKALVLWKPPPGVIDSNIATIASSYKNNNNCNVVTYRTSPTSTITITELNEDSENNNVDSVNSEPIPSTSASFMDTTSVSPISTPIPETVDYEMEL